MPPKDKVAKKIGKAKSAPAGVSVRAGRSQQWPKGGVWESLVGEDCNNERGQTVASRRIHCLQEMHPGAGWLGQ